MTSSGKIHVRVGFKWVGILFFTCVLSLLTSTPAQAQSDGCVSTYRGVIDGKVNPVPPAHIQFDGNCIIRNFPASNPFTSNSSFYGNNPTSWLVIFDNVVFTGNMSCDKSQGNFIWFTNGSTSGLKPNCQNLFVPTEKINKQNPAGKTTATIGVPFTYKMTIPVMFDPVTGTVINSSGSPNDLHDITITDDLNATGADLTFVSQSAYWLNNGTPIPHTFSNAGGVLTFGSFPVVPAGQQFVIEVTVMLNDTPTNVPGKQFVNTAKWQFGRLIGGVFYEPLPGQWGVTPPMTIAAPVLAVRKSGPATMNLGQSGNFTLDVQNTGASDAWNVSLRDLLPHGATGGMCNLTPGILSAQVFAADGVTPVAGKGPLNQGSDYSLNYSAAPNCQLDITMLTAAGTIGPNQRLIIHYQTQLDANTQNGVTLTNIAGAIQWFNGDSSIASRKTFTGPLTNGTPGILDNQDAFTVTVALAGFEFDKTVANLTSGASPATTAAPGDKLRYTLRFRTTGQGLSNFSIFDDMDALNAQADFTPGTLTLVASPAGADTSATSSTGGTKGTGVIDVRNLSLPPNGVALIQFDITLKSPIANGTVVANQAMLRFANGATFAWSDDPNVNGTADPTVSGGGDPTRVTIVSSVPDPALVVRKSGPSTMNLGQSGNFTLDIQNTGASDAWNVSLRDLLPHGATGGMCNTTPGILSAQVFAGDGVTPVAGKAPLNPGSDYSLSYSAAPNCQLDITMLTTAGTIGPNQRLIIHYQTQLDANTQSGVTLTNVAGATQWFNGDSSVASRKTYTGPLTNGTPGIVDNQDAFTLTVALTGYEFDKTVANLTSGANPATTAVPGDKLRYTLRFRTTSQVLSNFRILDDLDALNAQADFAPGTLALVTTPAGADTSATSATGGTKGTGVIDIRNLSLPANGVALIQFDITLKSPIANGTVVANQATLRLATGTTFAWSDDPNVNGTADPTVSGAEDPTRVTIVSSVSDPALVVRKSGPATMNLGQPGNFTLDVQNTGASDAWNVTLRDLLPHLSTGGMCNMTPGILIAQVFAADGVTPVAGKAPLNQGSDYSLSYSAAPNCQLDITMLTAAGTIGPNQRLIIHYQTQLDANTQSGVTLTNVAGAIQWFNGDSSVASRKTYPGPLTNGTPGIVDNQDVFTVTVALTGYFFDKTVANLTSGANPATTAVPGDKLRYTLRFRTTGQDLSNFRILDDLDALNVQADFAPGTLTLVAFPTGADTSATNSTGGTKGTGVIDVSIPFCLRCGTRNVDLPVNGEILIQFDITLKSDLTNGTVVTNQAALRLADGTTFALSDDPNVNGTTDPTRVTIVSSVPAPALVVTKSGPATMNLGQWGNFNIDVQNTGLSDAWNVSLRDLLPHGATGGMCDLTPEILSAQVFAADGVTPVPGKGPLTVGTDYSRGYSAAPNCQLDITMLTARGTIGPNQRLILTYRTQLDINTQNGVTLTNIAGTIQWFNADSSNSSRKTYTGALTNGTPGILDNQDAFTVTTVLSGWFFEKTVANLASGINPATTAAPGDKLRYTLRFRTTNQALSNFRIFDDMDGLNAQADFAPGTLTLVTSPGGADISATSSTGGTKRTGVIDIRNLSLPASGEVLIQFDITLKTAIANNTVVANQATLFQTNGTTFALSDDPNVNGTANPNVSGDEDPTRVTIASAPAFRVQKISSDMTGDPNVLLPGDTLRYTITAKNISNADAVNVVLRDAVPANTTYVAGSTTLNGAKVVDVAGVSALVSGMPINSPANATPGSMPADASSSQANVATITFDVVVGPNAVSGTVISNQGFVSAPASGVVDQPSDDPRTPTPNDPTLNIVGGVAAPALVVRKSGPTTMNLGQWGSFGIDVQNTGPSDAWNTTIRDLLPHGATGGMCDLTPEILSAQVFAADGVTPVPGKGPLNKGSDYSLSYNAAPNCQLDITMLTPTGTIGPNQRLIIGYRTQLDANSQNGATLTNVAGAIQWFNADSSNTNRKASTGTLTNGTPGIVDNQDAHTVTVALSGWFFEKTVADLTTGVNPATTAVPGDKLRYTLRFRTTSQALSNFRIFDDMDALNAQPDFAPGTLTLVTAPAGADISTTSSTGGTKGTGVIDIRNLSLPATGGEVLIQFDITLKPVIANGTIVTNQATLFANGTTFALSDDPNVNGVADPNISGDEDPTRVTIAASSVFRVQKISTYLRDPNVLLAGDTLRYTITVKNISNADAVSVALRDATPANTAYMAGSTTLNGAKVADVAGASPLVNGMPINSPANPTPGLMPADSSSSQANVATITFDVVVNPNTPDGTIISNQGVVSATGIVDQPSDDPRTPVPNDPTQDKVGNRPVLDAEKRVLLFTDLGSPGIVDPGDVLRYTITIKNSSTIPATGVVLKDPVPANTTYIANSTLLSGGPVGQPDGGASPLASGINIGAISPGTTAVLQYDMRVNLGTPAGTQISNQAVVSSPGLPNLLTDSDGNPANGPQPTVVVVGAGQQVSISEQVSVVGGGAAIPGAQLEYVVKATNIGAVAAFNVVISDDLNGSQPGQLAYVNSSATVNGSASGVSFAGSNLTVNYAAVNGPLAPGAVVELRFRATLNPNLALGTVVTNTSVVAWNNPTQTANANVSTVVGSTPGIPRAPAFAVLNGAVWHDADFDDVRGSGERALAGWVVELYRDNQLSQSVQTDANGAYSITSVEPNNATAVRYELRFHAPGAGANTALLGRAASPFTNGLQRISDIIVPSGANLEGLNLPIHPNGVIYNSVVRTPVVGATLTLIDARSASPLPAGCFDDAAQQGQITLADGYYKFDINFSDPACPSGGDYLIGVTAPLGTTYVTGYSQIIPPASSTSTAAFSVPSCPGSAADAIPSTAQFCEAQPSEFAPAASVQPRSAGTTYYIRLRLDNSQIQGSSQIFNNHIPLDPQLLGSITITKTTPLRNVSRGQLVPYTITANNHSGQLFTDVSIVDRLPAGFSYIKGSALLDGVPTEPSVAGLTLNWNGLTIAGTQVRTVKLLLAVGAGVTEGEFVNRAQVLLAVSAGVTAGQFVNPKVLNRAQVLNPVTEIAMSGEATATVRLAPDPTFDCTDVMGKVFNDENRNGRQDDSEQGLSGVRVVTPQGLQATTDQYGRYHITCAITPNESRGSNFVLKLDDRTLPSGFRMSTDQVQIQRATSGKALQANFGASIHRVVAIDLLDAAFEPGATEIRGQWKPRLNLLLDELHKAPAVLRLSYVADTEDAALVKRRVEAVKRQLTEAWGASNDSYVLTIEPEVFWRRGAPPRQPKVRVPESR